jgi:N-acetylglucosaminyl-diphospho-decaprenol L-rhamnosyltransferase
MTFADRREHAQVSVVIVNYNGGGVLDPCLRAVFTQSYRPIEVILVDNASTDGSAENAALGFPEMRVIRNRSNTGFATANNLGVAAATGRYVVLLNNDTEVQEGWIPGLLGILADPGVGAVTSRVVTDGVPAEFYAMNGTINFLGYNIMRHFADLSRIFFAGGASLMFRRDEVGPPFPDEYFLYHEDVHLSWRLRLQGRDVRMAQDSVVLHRGSVTTKRQPGRLVTFYQERNRLLNTLVMFEFTTLALLLPYLVADGLAKLVAGALGGRKSVAGILEAYVWVMTHAGWIRRERKKMRALRTVPDREILNLMSSRVIDGEGPVARLLNGLSRTYARITGLQP